MKVFNILDYGAKFCDALQTAPIQKAIDDCFLAGGGRVVIPCGVYITGGIRLRSNVELYLETGAILKGSRDPEDYFGWKEDTLEPVTVIEPGDTPKTGRSSIPTSRWSNGLIRAMNAKNIKVTGEKGSYIDGCYCYDPLGEQEYRGPHGMSIWDCENIHLEGYILLTAPTGAMPSSEAKISPFGTSESMAVVTASTSVPATISLSKTAISTPVTMPSQALMTMM